MKYYQILSVDKHMILKIELMRACLTKIVESIKMILLRRLIINLEHKQTFIILNGLAIRNLIGIIPIMVEMLGQNTYIGKNFMISFGIFLPG
jgi:hypothetical protein